MKGWPLARFSKHLKDFCLESRGNVLERQGEPRTYRYKFKQQHFVPFIVLSGAQSALFNFREYMKLI